MKTTEEPERKAVGLKQKKTLSVCVIGLVLVAVSALSSAEFYRYVDQEGSVHYTDNLENVPADQRPTVNTYDEIYSEDSGQPEEERAAEVRAESGEGVSKRTYLEERTPTGKSEEEALEEKLTATGAELLEEYEELMQKRERLNKTTQSALTPPERERLAEEIRELNAQIKDYEEKRDAFDKEVDAYNAQIRGDATSTTSD